jgi:hypothetical protein
MISADHRQAQPFGGIQVDIVVARAAQRDAAHAEVCQNFQRCRVELVVDEGADRAAPRRERRGGGIEARFQGDQFVGARRVGGRQKLAVVGLRSEHGDAHVAMVPRFACRVKRVAGFASGPGSG